MAGTKRKRQRTTAKRTFEPVLGSETTVSAASVDLEAAEKDDEERELESFLFGTAASTSNDRAKPSRAADALVDDFEAGFTIDGDPTNFETHLDHVLDEDLFILDTDLPSEPSTSKTPLPPRSENTDNESDDNSSTTSTQHAPLQSTSKRKKPAWHDPSDAHISISLQDDKRLRKLRDAPGEDGIDGRTYESKLRRKYEELNPTPSWASSARERARGGGGTKRRRASSSATSSDAEDDEDGDDGKARPELDHLLQNASGLLASSSSSSRKSRLLPQGAIEIERLRDANHAAVSEGTVTAARFHPSPSVPVMMTIGLDRRLRLFTIDGLTNPLLQTLHIPSLSSPSQSSKFHPSGTSILLTSSNRSFFYTYNLESGQALQSARGLWNGIPGGGGEGGEGSMDVARFSADGRMLAVAGRRGYVHLLDWGSGSGSSSSGSVVASLKAHAPIKDVSWVPSPSGSSGGSKHLMTLTQDAEVYIWDVGQRRCVARWRDDGNFGAGVLASSLKGGWCAIGSSTGIVNIYGSDAGSPSPSSPNPRARKALKTLTNLTTAITSTTFDPSGQMMAYASRAKKDSFRLVHLPSLTTFANWPTSGTPLGTVSSVDFSPGSEYVAVGNTRGKVLLFGLKHFNRGGGV